MVSADLHNTDNGDNRQKCVRGRGGKTWDTNSEMSSFGLAIAFAIPCL